MKLDFLVKLKSESSTNIINGIKYYVRDLIYDDMSHVGK